MQIEIGHQECVSPDISFLWEPIMAWNEVAQIELNIRQYGKAEIVLRRKDGTAIKVMPVKWPKRYEALSRVTDKWLSHKE
jgi:hypothetical protein